MAWTGHELVAFGSSFETSGLGASGSMGEDVRRNDFKHLIQQEMSPAWGETVQLLAVAQERVEGAFEGHTGDGALARVGSFQHQQSQQVAGDKVEVHLFESHGGALAAQQLFTIGALAACTAVPSSIESVFA